MNLRVDIFETPCHAQEYMKLLGISYTHCVPSSLFECWWFWNCSNVPTPLPKGITEITMSVEEFIGHGLSEKDVQEIKAYKPTSEGKNESKT